MRIVEIKFRFAVIIFLFLFLVGDLAHGQSTNANAEIVLQKMIARYSSVSSYQDFGEVRIVYTSPSIASSSEAGLWNVSLQNDLLVSFKTYYSSPQKFRFEWTSSSIPSARESVIWSDGDKIYSWMPISPKGGKGFTLMESASLRSCFDSASPSSAGANYIVPSLLIKDSTYFSFADILSISSAATVQREEQFDGETCYVIKVNISGVPWVMWVGKESYLLRKTRTRYSDRPFGAETTDSNVVAEESHHDIRINQAIPRDVFSYKPQILRNDLDLSH